MFLIHHRKVGEGFAPFIIAEVAQAHEGSLGMAHAYIDAVAQTGAHAIKFQTHIADAESTLQEPWRVHFSYQDKTRYDYWKRMEFTPEQWRGLAQHAEQVGLIFLSSPFSRQAVDILRSLNIGAWKVGSGEIENPYLLHYLSQDHKPVLLSSGMSNWVELSQAVQFFKALDIDVGIFQCTSKYPCEPRDIGLNVLNELRQKFDCPVGLSDHSGTIYPGLAAIALGAHLIEVHVTLSKASFGPDVVASVTMEELKQLCDGASFIFDSLSNPIDKNEFATRFTEQKKIFSRSLVASKPLKAGTLLSEEDIAVKKPGGGEPPEALNLFIGKRLLVDIDLDQVLTLKDIAS